jgi:(2Fe-2S) ferredoxin
MKSEGQGRITICRGCCCGVATGRHQGAERRLSELQALIEFGYQIVTSDCLGPCQQGDIIVLSEGIRSSKPLWFREMHVQSLHELFVEWIRSGRADLTGQFELLLEQQFQPSRKQRKVTNDETTFAS